METRWRSKKQVGEWKQVKDDAQGTKINSKVFAIPILTAI